MSENCSASISTPAAAAPQSVSNPTTLIVILVLAVGGLFVLVTILALGIRSWRRERAQENKDKAQAAIETTRRMRFVACFIRASDFLSMGELKSHEVLRNEGRLVYRDTFDDLAHGDDYVIFLSHQWLGYDAPDPDGVQYPCMARAVEQIATRLRDQVRDEFESEPDDQHVSLDRILRRILVWVDYVSIPQLGEETLQLAIQSLSAYCSLANDFVICAPKATHSDSAQECNFSTYRKRMWCRAEQLCHMLRNGAASIWLATADSCERTHTKAR